MSDRLDADEGLDYGQSLTTVAESLGLPEQAPGCKLKILNENGDIWGRIIPKEAVALVAPVELIIGTVIEFVHGKETQRGIVTDPRTINRGFLKQEPCIYVRTLEEDEYQALLQKSRSGSSKNETNQAQLTLDESAFRTRDQLAKMYSGLILSNEKA